MVASMVKSDVLSPVDIETLATLRGLQFCMHHWFSNLIIESDCLLVVEAPKSILENLFLDIRKLTSHFVCYKIQYGNRLGNTIAPRLARHASHVSNVAQWFGDVPSFLEQNVWFDKFNL